MATEHTYRVTVRGRFDSLDPEARERLLAEADAFEAKRGRFTEGGTLRYRPDLTSFAFRYLVTADSEEGDELASLLAEERAVQTLDEAGYGYAELRSEATDMDAGAPPGKLCRSRP
ncbi:DUF6204 family protein [Streptomyces sp. NPDC050610]|uniref:DUF6204 family protein n=1 Tax=Streptomyces sp. NPDC050610 TaxID=3157097 RepID=UPI003420B3E4